MKNSILKQKSIELDASLLDLINEDVDNSTSTLRISLFRACETLGVGANYIKPLLDNLYQEVKDFQTEGANDDSY